MLFKKIVTSLERLRKINLTFLPIWQNANLKLLKAFLSSFIKVETIWGWSQGREKQSWEVEREWFLMLSFEHLDPAMLKAVTLIFLWVNKPSFMFKTIWVIVSMFPKEVASLCIWEKAGWLFLRFLLCKVWVKAPRQYLRAY